MEQPVPNNYRIIKKQKSVILLYQEIDMMLYVIKRELRYKKTVF